MLVLSFDDTTLYRLENKAKTANFVGKGSSRLPLAIVITIAVLSRARRYEKEAGAVDAGFDDGAGRETEIPVFQNV